MRRGVLACLAAGAIWGGIFVGPRMLPQFDAVTFSLARYLCFGLLSCMLFAWARRAGRASPIQVTRRDLATAAWLGFIGNLVYFVALVLAIQLTSIAYASLIVGLLPVTTTLVADWRERRAGIATHGLRTLIPPLMLVAAGVVAVNADLFLHLPVGQTGTSLRTIAGVIAAFVALAAWTVYAADNADFLRAHPAFDVRDWATLQGIGTLLWVIGALLLWALAAGFVDALPAPHLLRALDNGAFVGWILFLGIGASWVGTSLWNYGTRTLAATLSGQMIVFETVFGLLYGFLYEARWPRPLESAGIVCLLAGVTWAVRAHDRKTATA